MVEEKQLVHQVNLFPMLFMDANSRVSSCQRYRPAKEDSILKYLSSGLIKGLGPATAKKIVNKFGEESFNVLQFEPLKLTEIKGISAEKALFFSEAFIEQENMRSIIMFMNQFGISSNIAVKVWNLWESGRGRGQKKSLQAV